MKNRLLFGLCTVVAVGSLAAIPGFAQDASQPPATPVQPPAAPAQPPAADPTAKPVDPDAALLAMVGKPAPAFTLPDQNDKPVTLGDSKGKWVVLAFYPADMTTGCTFQNRSYSQNIDKFAPLNAVVYTVSTQNTASKREFCSKESLKHTLLSDVGGKTATAYGVLRGPVARRVTFYIDPTGKIAAVDTKIHVQKAADDSLAMLQKLAPPPKPAESAEKTTTR